MFALLRMLAKKGGGKPRPRPFGFAPLALLTFSAALILGGCGGQVASGGQAGAFDEYLTANNLLLPNTIDFDDFDEACRRRGLLHSADYLESIGITIQGSGDGRYLSGKALLHACGEQCSPNEGLGDLLSDLTTYNITNR
ncbi:MAG: hypothetical protein ACR2P4_01430 [Gammaproteobacteria bacterium]